MALAAADESPPPSNPEGQALAAELRDAGPLTPADITGWIRIRDADGRRWRVRFQSRIVPEEDGWRSIYETASQAGQPGECLVVIHRTDRPNQYLHTRFQPGADPPPEPVLLSGSEAMIPFAGSDFWLADLGLEFLHWPEQRLVEELKIRMRKGRPCKILDSTNPNPVPGGYARVRSWIDNEKRGVIMAEAYGPDNRRLKEFEVGSLTKVSGRWQIKNLEMRNLRADTRSLLEFQYQEPD